MCRKCVSHLTSDRSLDTLDNGTFLHAGFYYLQVANAQDLASQMHVLGCTGRRIQIHPIRRFQKREPMTRETNHGAMWRALFDEQKSQLTEIAEILLYRCGSPEQIVQSALTQLEHEPFYEPSAKVSSFRAVVKATIAYNYSIDNPETVLASRVSVSERNAGPLPLESLPWAERAVYFLREVLQYSRRDTALLLAISDANVDQLSRFAKKRIGIRADRPVNAVRSVQSLAYEPPVA